MFIGNNSVTLSGNINVQAESAGFMDPVEEALYNVAVDEANYNKILGCLAIAEVTAAHNGLDPASVYTEGTISDFWEKIKEFFKKLWAKIKGLWAKLVATFDQHVKSGKEFIDKYKKTLNDKFNKIDKDKVKFSGYKFTISTFLSGFTSDKITQNLLLSGVITNLFKNANPDDDTVTELEEKYRGELIGESSNYTLKEMTKELHDKLRDGGTKDNDLEGITYEYIFDILSNSDKAKKEFDKTLKNIERTMNQNIKNIERAHEANIKNAASKSISDEDISKNSKAIRYIKTCLGTVQAAAAELAKAMKDEVSQAKGFAAQVLRAGVRDGYEESARISGNSVFGMVNLV